MTLRPPPVIDHFYLGFNAVSSEPSRYFCAAAAATDREASSYILNVRARRLLGRGVTSLQVCEGTRCFFDERFDSPQPIADVMYIRDPSPPVFSFTASPVRRTYTVRVVDASGGVATRDIAVRFAPPLRFTAEGFRETGAGSTTGLRWFEARVAATNAARVDVVGVYDVPGTVAYARGYDTGPFGSGMGASSGTARVPVDFSVPGSYASFRTRYPFFDVTATTLVWDGCSAQINRRQPVAFFGEPGAAKPPPPKPEPEPGATPEPMPDPGIYVPEIVRVCTGGTRPAGFLKINDELDVRGVCGGSAVTYPIDVLQRYDDAPRGTLLGACSGEAVPPGYTKLRDETDGTRCGHSASRTNNVMILRRD